MVDLTKEIKLSAPWTTVGASLAGELRTLTCFSLIATDDDKAYSRLFQAAPKMLAILKEINRDGYCECSIYDCENSSHQIASLIAEIEGDKK